MTHRLGPITHTAKYPNGLPTWTEFKPLWLTALLNGSYEQAFDRLRDDTKPNCFCAVGIGCDLLGIKPDSVGHWGEVYATLAKIIDPTETYQHGLDVVCTVVNLNDVKRAPLATIANYLETVS